MQRLINDDNDTLQGMTMEGQAPNVIDRIQVFGDEVWEETERPLAAIKMNSSMWQKVVDYYNIHRRYGSPDLPTQIPEQGLPFNGWHVEVDETLRDNEFAEGVN